METGKIYGFSASSLVEIGATFERACEGVSLQDHCTVPIVDVIAATIVFHGVGKSLSDAPIDDLVMRLTEVKAIAAVLEALRDAVHATVMSDHRGTTSKIPAAIAIAAASVFSGLPDVIAKRDRSRETT